MIEVKEKHSLSVIRLSDADIADSSPLTTFAPRKKLMKLEAIRGFAALYVVCHHTLPKSTFIFGKEFFFFRYGQEAVILFFILSGFVIQYAFATSSDKSFKSFFLKRFLRIYIPLLCVFATHYLIAIAYQYQLSGMDWQSFFGNLLMIQQVDVMWRHPVLVSPFLGNLPLWSLSFEWWFYMIFFFVASRFKDKASKVVYIASMISAVVYLFYPVFAVREVMYLGIWWAGADLAKLYIQTKNISIKNLATPLLSLSFITVILACNILSFKQQHPKDDLMLILTPMVEVRHFGFAIAAIVIAIYWKKLHWFGFKYTFGWFETLAPISFCLYISHWFLISHAEYMNHFIDNYYVRAAAYFLICCAFCYLVERIIYPYLNKKILGYFLPKTSL